MPTPLSQVATIRDARRPTGSQELYRVLAEDEPRNELIVRDTLDAIDEGRCPLVLTGRRDHLDGVVRGWAHAPDHRRLRVTRLGDAVARR